MLVEREVITSEDVERVLGPRQWKSRGDEIIAANEAQKQVKPKAKRKPKAKPVTEEPTETEAKEA